MRKVTITKTKRLEKDGICIELFLIPTAMGPHGHEQERGHRAGRIRRVSREEMKTIYLPT